MKFLKATLASVLIALAIVVGANPRNVYSQAQALLYGSFSGAAKAVTVTSNGYLNVSVQGGSGGTGSFSALAFTGTLAGGSGTPTSTQPINWTFSTNTNQQFLFWNSNTGANAAAETCTKSDTDALCFSAVGPNYSSEPQRAQIYSNCGLGCTSGLPGIDIWAGTGATPTLQYIRFCTNSATCTAGERARIDAVGVKLSNASVLGSAAAAGANDVGLSRIAAATYAIGNGAAGDFAGTLKTTSLFLAGKATTYNNITTAGAGLPFVVSAGDGVAISSALDANRCTFTPAADGSFEIWDYILVTTAGAATNMNGTITFKSEEGTARSVAIVWQLAAGGTVTNVLTAAGVVGYYGYPIRIRAQASTAITVSTTGTQSTAVYNHRCSIMQIS